MITVSAPEPAPSIGKTMSMTSGQRDVIILLAEVYLSVGRPRRAAMLAALTQADHPHDVPAMRVMLRAHLALGETERAMGFVDRLVDHEFDSEELAFTLSAQAQALAGQGDKEGARAVWAQYVSLCAVSGLTVTEAMA